MSISTLTACTTICSRWGSRQPRLVKVSSAMRHAAGGMNRRGGGRAGSGVRYLAQRGNAGRCSLHMDGIDQQSAAATPSRAEQAALRSSRGCYTSDSHQGTLERGWTRQPGGQCRERAQWHQTPAWGGQRGWANKCVSLEPGRARFKHEVGHQRRPADGTHLNVQDSRSPQPRPLHLHARAGAHSALQHHSQTLRLAWVLKLKGSAKRKTRRQARAGTRHCRYERSP